MSAERGERLQQDLHPPLTRHEALVESDRCYFCYDAPCVTACPTGIDIPLFIRQISTDNPKGSARTIFDENILGGMCARVCPTETLCEQACVRNTAEDNPVRIGELQRYSTDHLMRTGKQPYKRAADTGSKIAVVGAGPAGLACAHRLALYGHSVDIYDANHKPGGLNEYGIAAYKTVDDFAQAEVQYILSIGGISLKHNQGIGLGDTNALQIEGIELEGVLDAVDFISNLRQVKDPASMSIPANTVVIGGGMTAIDAAVQTHMLGAQEVTIAYRRGVEHMSASVFEQDLAKVNTSGNTQAAAETIIIPCNQVLIAIGQRFNASEQLPGVALKNGRLQVDENRRTSDEKLWAGGDCIDGGEDLTVAAVQDGKLAAESIHSILQG